MLIHKKIFLLGLSAFIASSFVFVESSFASSNQAPSQAELDNLRSNISELEGIVARHLRDLNTCRERCKQRCRTGCERYIPSGSDRQANPEEIARRDQCLSECTDAKCDENECRPEKAKYDYYNDHLDNYKKRMGEANEETRKRGSADDPVTKKIDRGEKWADILAGLGVGTTAIYCYKAKTCCSGKPCPMCGLWTLQCGQGTLQTAQMFAQRDKFHETKKGLCAGNSECHSYCKNNPSDILCDSACSGGADDPPHCRSYCAQNPRENHCQDPPPSCQSNLEACNTIRCETDPTSECAPTTEEPTCEVGDSDCTPPSPNPPDGGSDGTFTVAPVTTIPEKVYEAFDLKPPPKGALADPKNWIKNNSTPAQRKKLAKMQKSINQKNKAYLKKMGFTDEELEGGQDAQDGLESDATSGSPQRTLGSAGANAFGKVDDSGSSSFAGSENSKGRKRAGSGKNLLAKQMEDMLKRLYPDKSKAKSLKDMSVNFGGDIVGVAEDNIFMMVHRRHRNLDEDRAIFIREGF